MSDQTETNQNAFSQKLTDILNYGALNLAMGLGYRARLFDIMDILETPQPVSIISKKAELNERYVLEWLGIMVSGGIVHLSKNPEGENLFHLPKAHGDLITRRAENNMGVYTQEIPLLTATVFDAVEGGFRTGKGISYEMYPGFQQFMAELADAKHRQVLVSRFLPSVLKGEMVKKLNDGISVCDMGCGEGTALILMAEAFPRSRFLGIDISGAVLEKGESTAKEKNLRNITFQKQDCATLTEDGELRGSLDYVTAFDAIHDQTQPMKALEGIRAILKDGGIFSMVDIAAHSDLAKNTAHPMGMFLYTVSLMHCMPVGLADGGTGLGMMWGKEKAVEMLQTAGFSQVAVEEIPEDSFNLHFLCRKRA